MTTVYVDNTNAILLEGLHSEIDDAYINDATVTVTVKDSSGVAVTGASWPKTMTYVAASDGNYRAVLEDTIALIVERKFVAEITANGGSDRIGRWKLPFWPEQRR